MTTNSPHEAADLARVIISPHAQYRGLFLGLICELSRSGSVILVVVPDAQRADYWIKRTRDLANVSIKICDQRYSAAVAPTEPPDKIIAKARSYERALGTTINHLSVRDRHLGRGYSLGGFYHPRSRISETASYLQMVAAFTSELDFWTECLDTFGPTLLVNAGELAWRLATLRGIPYRALAGSRYKSLHNWAHDEWFRNPRIVESYKDNPGADLVPDLSQPYSSNRIYVSKFARENSFANVLMESVRDCTRFVYWSIRGYEKARGYYVAESIAYRWRRRSAYLRMQSHPALTLKDLAGTQFAYYPLHTEPEAALQGLSPAYTFQLETIARIARLLPAGILLAVKETQPALGRRPTNFYDQLTDFKNVVILNVEERGIDVVAQAAVVTTITGTAGLEAALMGKPVISFGTNNLYNVLPHVHIVTDEHSLEAAVRAAFDPGHDKNAAKREGARFLAAIAANSFDLKGFDFTNPETVDAAMISAFTQGLADSLREPA